jgi:hypothetical protein
MHPYTQRNIRAWHRRLSPLGWTIRVVDLLPNSPLNVSNFLDVTDPATFPQAFTDGTIGGPYALQHTSDLVRWPLLLKYGGVYADVGLMQIGDLDRLWNETIGDPDSPFEVLSYNAGPATEYNLTNYFLCSERDNALFRRCHELLLKLWEGKTSTEGLHTHPLLKGVNMIGDDQFSEETSRELSDYIIQGQAMKMVMGSSDPEDNWDGPRYTTEHVYAIPYIVGSQLINELTAWDGKKAFELMSLKLPNEVEVESEEQGKAREIVEQCLGRSFGFKLAHGLILKVLGDTLGSLWRKNTGSDDVVGTYAHWLRHGTVYWTQDGLPTRLEFERISPFKVGPLLREK